ncbi:unnamed protein product [Blepharisma stoltei]|uniref:Small nuclear ribonucleoprotein G n=1 Tax=Blepharisma stoltei TaxID=1481888 RepID=A0AAU9J2C6_9CILI|nr:unnamed protein product [Blepharisma stoltei]
MAAKQGYGPDLKKYLNLNVDIKLNGNRRVCGVLRGYDQLMNLVLENAYEIAGPIKREIGSAFIRGNSVIMWECIDKVVS